MNISYAIAKEIIDEHRKHNLERPFIVAIDGLSGAGKTTLVQHLKKLINNAVIISIDDHIVKRNLRYDTEYDEWYEYYQLQWDTASLQKCLYEKLHQNASTIALHFYNKEDDTISTKPLSIPPNSIVIIEGIFLLRHEWKPFYDYAIFLDCPQEKRYRRVLKRDTYIGDLENRIKKYKNRYWMAEKYYFNKHNPHKNAHSIYRV